MHLMHKCIIDASCIRMHKMHIFEDLVNIFTHRKITTGALILNNFNVRQCKHKSPHALIMDIYACMHKCIMHCKNEFSNIIIIGKSSVKLLLTRGLSVNSYRTLRISICFYVVITPINAYAHSMH